MFEQISQLDGRSRFAVGIKWDGPVPFAINLPPDDLRRREAELAFRAAIPSRSRLATGDVVQAEFCKSSRGVSRRYSNTPEFDEMV